MASAATMPTATQQTPSVSVACTVPMPGFMANQMLVMGTAIARTKLGALVAAVARRLVPNCSLAVVTKIAQ